MNKNRGEKLIFSNQNLNENSKVSKMEFRKFKENKKEKDLLNSNFNNFIKKEEEIELSLKKLFDLNEKENKNTLLKEQQQKYQELSKKILELTKKGKTKKLQKQLEVLIKKDVKEDIKKRRILKKEYEKNQKKKKRKNKFKI